MKNLFFIVVIMFTQSAGGYDEYNILINNKLNKDELEYFKLNCKNTFSYTCLAIQEKIKETKKNG